MGKVRGPERSDAPNAQRGGKRTNRETCDGRYQADLSAPVCRRSHVRPAFTQLRNPRYPAMPQVCMVRRVHRREHPARESA